MDFELPRQEKRRQEDEDAFVVDEILVVHQQQGGGGNQPDRHGAQAQERGLDVLVVLEFDKIIGDAQYQQEGGQANGEGRQARAEDGHRRRISRVVNRRVADVGRAVDANRPRRHLRDGDDVGKFLEGYPAVAIDHVGLDKRQHGVAPAETEDADLQIDV